jgi:protein-tyrosine-phosphatase
MRKRVGLIPSSYGSEALASWLTGPAGPPRTRTVQPPPRVLFLSRSNTAVSIMAEAILEHWADGRVRAASAGDRPFCGQVSPYALDVLVKHGVATQGLRSKAWGEFFGEGKPAFRFLITLCQVEAARLNWECDSKRLVRACWDMPDPVAMTGSAVELRFAFDKAFATLESRIRKFLALPVHRLADRNLARELERIGEEPAGFPRVAPEQGPPKE